MISHDEVRIMREATDKQRLDLPSNWRSTIKKVCRDCYVADIAAAFGVSLATLQRWRRKEPEFHEQVLLRMKYAPGKKPKPKQKHEEKTDIDIDDVLIDLRLQELSSRVKDRDVFIDAQAAINQLRQQLRAAISDAQRVRQAAHFRATGGAARPHATGGIAQNTGIGDVSN